MNSKTNEIYTDLESKSISTDNVSEKDPMAQYWRDELRIREKAVELTVEHFNGKDNVQPVLFNSYIQSIYIFLKEGKI